MTESQNPTPTSIARRGVLAALAIATAILSLLLLASSASADSTICTAGSGAGQCSQPQGIATDFQTGLLYVADQGNNRIDVFDSSGKFEIAFGWGVDTGTKELQTCTAASTCQAGIAGSGAGQLDHPTWIAVDNDPSSTSRHDVYVGTDNFRVQKFHPGGEFVKAFGSQGSGECQFNRTDDPLAVGPGGDVYVADHFEAAPQSFTNRVERFDSAGNCEGEVELFKGSVAAIRNFAVDSKGNSYVTAAGAGGVIRKYGPTGTLEYELDNGTETEGLAVDGSDNLFAKQRGTTVAKDSVTFFFTEYDSAGTILRRFGYGLNGLPVPGLAAYHSAGGDLFASKGGIGVEYLTLPAGPVVMPRPCKVKAGTLGNTKATLLAEVNPEGKATTIHYEYVTQKHFEDEGFSNPEVTDESASIGADFAMHEATGEAEVAPETEYRCRVVATNADAPAGVKGQEGAFTSRPPLEIADTTVTGVGSETATLNATVNPLGIETSGYFEYVEEATYLEDVEGLGPEHGFDHAGKAPQEGLIEFGSSESFVARSAALSGLKPATPYRYRLIATDPFLEAEGKAVEGPTQSFRTFGADAEALPDERAWELVSPGLKNSAEVAVPGTAGGFTETRRIRIEAAATGGDAITYTSWTSFGEAEGAQATSQYLSKRGAGGWQTENISPFGFLANVFFPPYIGFSPDLAYGAFKTNEPALTPDCRKNEGLYLRDNTTGELRCLVPEVPGGPEAACLVYTGSSEDGSRAFFAGKPEGEENFKYSLYEWTPAGGPQLLSILPSGSPAQATNGTAFGPGGNSFSGPENCQVTRSVLRHAISTDGSRVFWTFVPEEGTGKASQLLARVDGSETVQLDAKQAGGAGSGDGVFRGAGADGSIAYFTDAKKLIAGANPAPAEPDLYRYELGGEKPLTDLTAGAGPGGVQGVVGISDDGAYVYFVAKAALSGGAENEAGQTAKAGANNLYLYHEGKTSFIAILAGADRSDWESEPRSLSARVSPDGRHLAFLSTEAEALAGYENTVATGEHCQYRLDSGGNLEIIEGPLCKQAFVYDADSGALTCASCNPSGSRPLGPTVLPGWTNPFEGPRYLSDDGSRLFFSSFDALSPADQNEKLDVYEFEQAGAGTCTAQSPAFDPASGGCHFLISSGKSTDESFLIDASADGRDVFLSTRGALTGWDLNENFDVYDAREGGGFAEPSEEQICQGEACRAPAAPAPVLSSPATPHFQGPGNPPAKKPKPHKRHAHKKKHAKEHHAKRADSKRRAGR